MPFILSRWWTLANYSGNLTLSPRKKVSFGTTFTFKVKLDFRVLARLCAHKPVEVPSSKLLLLTVPRRHPYLHLYFMYVLRVFLTSWCIIDDICAFVCVWVYCDSEVGLWFVLRFLLERCLIYSLPYYIGGKPNICCCKLFETLGVLFRSKLFDTWTVLPKTLEVC